MVSVDGPFDTRLVLLDTFALDISCWAVEAVGADDADMIAGDSECLRTHPGPVDIPDLFDRDVYEHSEQVCLEFVGRLASDASSSTCELKQQCAC